MNYWDSQMQEGELRSRLSGISSSALAVFTIGCTTHARDSILMQATESEEASYARPTVLLNQFWSNYPSALRDLQSYIDPASELAPSEDAKLAPGEGPLIWSMLYAFKCTLSTEPVTEAMAAVGDAYHSVYAFRFERGIFARDEGQIWEIEAGSPECLAEIQFQLCYLKFLEGIEGVPLSYAEIVKQMIG
jgi:hypothetical protein